MLKKINSTKPFTIGCRESAPPRGWSFHRERPLPAKSRAMKRSPHAPDLAQVVVQIQDATSRTHALETDVSETRPR
jgi:hypothetical protein